MKSIARLVAILTSVVLSLSHPGALAAKEVTYFTVKSSIKAAGKVIGTPEFTVAEGKDGLLVHEQDPYYSYRFKLNSYSAESESVDVSADVYLGDWSKWALVGKPAATFRVGRLAEFQMQDRDSGRSVILSVLVTRAVPNLTQLSSFQSNSCTEARLADWEQEMSRPIVLKAAVLQQECCSPSPRVRCCSSGPICCSDEANCPGGRCCTP